MTLNNQTEEFSENKKYESLHHSYPSRRKKQNRRSWIPNCYMMPGHDSIEISKKLDTQFQGGGGVIEQSGLYINPSSAARWITVANQADYLSTQTDAPYRKIAKHIADHHLSDDIEGLDLWALGSGDGKNETRFAQYVMSHMPDLRLLLVDSSFPLLSLAYDYAVSILGETNAPYVYAVCGNMYNLPHHPYMRLYSSEENKGIRRLITMFGYTLGNIENELHFVKNSLLGFSKGDLLLLDIVEAYAPATDEESVKKNDPRLAQIHPPDWDTAYEEFLSDTIYHYCRDIETLQFYQERDYGYDFIPGSYTISMKAHIKQKDSLEKTFTMMQYKRYDTNKLVLELERYGWRGSAGWNYGHNGMMYLFEKA